MKTKQVIVIRKDLKMRRDKEIVQACHASMGAILKYKEFGIDPYLNTDFIIVPISKESKEWLEGSFTKICVYVNSEKELLDLEFLCKEKNLLHYLIQDNGLTEFNGIKTYTALAIGPLEESKFIGVTDKLPLY